MMSEMGTGIQQEHRRGDNRRKGFFADPDWQAPRKKAEQKPEPSFSAYHKQHVMQKSVTEDTARAQPGDTAKVFSGECHASDYRPSGIDPGDGSVVGRKYYASKNSSWVNREDLVRDFEAEANMKEDFRREMLAQQRRDADRRQAEKRQRDADRALVEKYPFGRGASGKRADRENQNDPLEDLHRREHRGLDKVAGFSAAPTKGTRMAVKINVKESGGPARYEDHSDELRQRRRMQVKEAITLRDQIEESHELKQRVRRADAETAAADHGILEKIHHPKKKRTYGKQTVITEARKPSADKTLAKDLRSQISSEHERKNREQHPGRYEQFHEFDPFSKPYSTRKARDARRRRGADTGNTIEGSSLSNFMGTKGGGAPADPVTLPDGRRMHFRARNVDAEELEAEIKAQAEGTSEYGRPGAGAAIRLPNGKPKTVLSNVVDGERTGFAYERQRPSFKAKRARERAQTEHCIREHEALKQQQRSEARSDPNIATSLSMTHTPPGPTGKPKGEKLGLLMDPVVTRDPTLRSALERQVKEREHRKAAARAAKKEKVKSFADGLTPYTPAKARPRRHPPPEFNQEELSRRPVLLQDPAERDQLRRDLERDIESHRRRKKQAHERRLREEIAHADHGSFPGGTGGAGRVRRDKHGRVEARRHKMEADLQGQITFTPALV